LFQLNSVSSCAKNSAKIYLQEPLFSNNHGQIHSKFTTDPHDSF
jgi:hypothetical protein